MQIIKGVLHVRVCVCVCVHVYLFVYNLVRVIKNLPIHKSFLYLNLLYLCINNNINQINDILHVGI